MRNNASMFVLAAIGSWVAVPVYAQQSGTDNPPVVNSARVLSEEQIQTYWIYAQERLSKNDFRTAMATLYFLVNAQGLSDEMRETADNALLQAIQDQKNFKRGIRSNAVVRSSVVNTNSVPSVPTVTFEETRSSALEPTVELPETQASPSSAQRAKFPGGLVEREDIAADPVGENDNVTKQVTFEVMRAPLSDTDPAKNSESERTEDIEHPAEAAETERESVSVLNEIAPVVLKPDTREMSLVFPGKTLKI